MIDKAGLFVIGRHFISLIIGLGSSLKITTSICSFFFKWKSSLNGGDSMKRETFKQLSNLNIDNSMLLEGNIKTMSLKSIEHSLLKTQKVFAFYIVTNCL